MTWLLQFVLWLRRVLGVGSEGRAIRLLRSAEARREQAAAARTDQAAHAMAERSGGESYIALGTALRSDGEPFTVRLPERKVRGGGHVMVEGATGAGKSFLILAIVMQLLRRRRSGLVIIDMKGELAGLLRRVFVPALIATLPVRAARELA